MAYRPLDLTGKVAVVTGGTSGIGRALTRGLAEAGADVVPTSRRAEQVAAAADEVAALGRRTLRVSSDVTDRRSLEDALAAVVKALGRVDILVNCAGRTQRTPTLDVSEQEWSAIVDTNPYPKNGCKKAPICLTGAQLQDVLSGRHLDFEIAAKVKIKTLQRLDDEVHISRPAAAQPGHRIEQRFLELKGHPHRGKHFLRKPSIFHRRIFTQRIGGRRSADERRRVWHDANDARVVA